MNYYYQIEGFLRNNLGDVLQGIVTKPFLPVDAKVVDRENLSNIEDEGTGLLIANGWFNHSFEHFPPPANITPVYTSVHIANAELLKPKHIRRHFKKHAPIGCRDKKTLKLFLGWGIPAYYSNCMTITCTPRAPINTTGKGEALLVDGVDHPIPEQVKTKIEQLVGQELTRVSHNPQDTSGSFEEYAEKGSVEINNLLKRYCEAAIIITTKIHCALPCLGMGANVLLIHPDPSDPRLNTVKEYIKIFSFEEIKKMDRLPKLNVNIGEIRKRKTFLTSIIQESIAGKKNITASAKKKYLWLRLSSVIKAILYRFVVSLLMKLNIKSSKLERVFSEN